MGNGGGGRRPVWLLLLVGAWAGGCANGPSREVFLAQARKESRAAVPYALNGEVPTPPGVCPFDSSQREDCEEKKAWACLARAERLLRSEWPGDRCRAYYLLPLACRTVPEACVLEERVREPARMVRVGTPTFTPAAHEAKVSGTGVLECTVTEEGSVKDCVVRQSMPFMDAEFLRAATHSRFEPARLNGHTLAIRYLFVYHGATAAPQPQPEWANTGRPGEPPPPPAGR